MTVEIKQCDREAAWPVLLALRAYGPHDKMKFMQGQYDNRRTVQAFAEHRIAAEQRQSEPSGDHAAKMREALELLTNLDVSLVLTANYDEKMTVADFIRRSSAFAAVSKWFHDNQYSCPESQEQRQEAAGEEG